MCGALMMVFNDQENIIERYYEPGTEFIYWYNTSDLQQVRASAPQSRQGEVCTP